MIEVEIQNETHQTQERLRFAAIPRIGEGIRLREPNGYWASYDVIDLWYQQAEYGEIWLPYLHVRITPTEMAPASDPTPAAEPSSLPAHVPLADQLRGLEGDLSQLEFDPFKG